MKDGDKDMIVVDDPLVSLSPEARARMEKWWAQERERLAAKLGVPVTWLPALPKEPK